MSQGVSRDKSLAIVGLTKNQFYYQSNGLRPGKKPSEKRLQSFYTIYNNERSHSGSIGIPPAKFWALHEKNQIEVIPLEKRKVKFKLKVAYRILY